MDYKIKKQLKKLTNKQFAEDIKRYLKSPYEFYGIKVPEIRTLAKKLHEQHTLKEFYKIFNRLWKSNYHEEMSLAIYTLQLYKEEFDLKTWKFLKPKLKDMKSWDQIDSIGINVIGEIFLKYLMLKKEIIKLSNSKIFWFRRLAIVSTLPLIKKGKIQFSLDLVEKYLSDKEIYVQKATGWILREAGKQKPNIVKKFILKNITMPPIIFSYATEHMKDLRKLRKIKKLKNNKFGKFSFFKLKENL